MRKNVNKILKSWLDSVVPSDMAWGELEKLAKSAQLSPITIKKIRSRESFSADTIISLFLARGVSEEALTNLPQTEPTEYSKSLTEWNRFGMKLNEKQRIQFLKLITFLYEDWEINR